MTLKQILDVLDPKNQNLPNLLLQNNFKNLPVIYVPVIEDEEKKLKKVFPFLKKNLSGKKDENLQITYNNQVYNFIGIGPKKEVNSRVMRRFYGSVYLSSLGKKVKMIGLACPLEWLKEAAIGVHVAALQSGLFKSKPKKEVIPDVVFVDKNFKLKTAPAKKALKLGQVLAEGKNLMRLLGTLPPNILTPPVYAELVLQLAKKWGVRCNRIPKQKLKKYDLLNAVSAGSKYNSELLVFTIHPKKGKSKKSTVVAGKGLCYDSGGLQDKQSHMKFMKEDMSGSASVLGTVLSIAKGNLEVKETTYFILGLAESMMGSRAMRADDIYTAGDGQTVEIVHTDAEGRLVLADSICYAKNNFKNIHRFYTIATLTGSCAIALGDVYTGMICNNEKLTDQIIRTGKGAGEYMFAGPWDMEYDDNNSPVADIANLGENREAGWIKAGLFLYRFVPKTKKEGGQAQFCHIDIAGSIDMKEKGKSWRRKGLSSGVGVGLMTGLLTR